MGKTLGSSFRSQGHSQTRPLLFIPQDGSHGSQALLQQISVLCGLDVVPWGDTVFRLNNWGA